ncbi:MAG: SH3 domain-containing protein [Planctomycetota bacterium]|jgi:hypothetical protein
MLREVMLSTALCLLGSAAHAGEAPPVPTPEAPVEGIITAGRLNVRLRPDRSAPVLGQLMRDARAVVRRVAAGWCEIDMPPTFGVWISEKLVLMDGDASSLAEGESLEASVLRSGARLRSTPSLRGAVLDECAKGAKLRALRAFNGWLRVVAPADLRAYVHADYVALRGPAATEGPDAPAVVGAAGPARGRSPSSSGPRGAVPEAAAARIALAEDILSDDKCSLDEMRRALGLLEEALALEGSTEKETARIAARVRALLGRLPPSRWLGLFDEAEARHRREVEAVERTYAGPLREARKALDESAPLEHTARGTLLAPGPGSEAYRLVHQDTLLYEIDTRGRDLGVFVGKYVGVIGEARGAARPGGTPVVAATYVEELDPEAPGGR